MTEAFSRVETDSNIMQVRPRLTLPFTLKEETRVTKTHEPMCKPDFALQAEIFQELTMNLYLILTYYKVDFRSK